MASWAVSSSGPAGWEAAAEAAVGAYSLKVHVAGRLADGVVHQDEVLLLDE